MFFLQVFSDDVRLTLTTTCIARARLLFTRPRVFRTDSEAGRVSPRSVPLVARFRSHNYAFLTLFSFPNRLVSRKQLPILWVDAGQGRSLMLALFRSGIFLNLMGTKLYLSLAHNRDVCDEFLGRFTEALREVLS